MLMETGSTGASVPESEENYRRWVGFIVNKLSTPSFPSPSKSVCYPPGFLCLSELLQLLSWAGLMETDSRYIGTGVQRRMHGFRFMLL